MAAKKRTRTRPKRHKDVEFAVWTARGSSGMRHGDDRYYRTFEEATADAVRLSASRGWKVLIDTIVSSRAGARWWAGDWGAEKYDEDPDASVFQRIEVRASALGGLR